MPRIDLRVPIAEKDEAKRLGARWDPQGKTWYVPDGVDAVPLQQWIPVPPLPNIRAANWYLASATRECWRCHQISQVFAIVLPEGYQRPEAEGDPEEGDFWQTEYLPTRLSYVTAVSKAVAWQLQRTAPRYRLDYSRTTESYYWMNHCEHCEAKLGDSETFEESGEGFGMSENIRLLEMPEPFIGTCDSHTEEDQELLAMIHVFEESSNGIFETHC